jgi:PilZ domain-containing protein
MSNKRKEPRLRMRRFAKVVTGPQEPPVACVVWDFSQSGARLAVARPLMSLPPRFALHFDQQGCVERKCEIVWTDARFVGVKFV